MSKNSEAVKKYYSENCTEFKIRQLKEDAQAVKDYAAAHGCRPMVIINGMYYNLELDNIPSAPSADPDELF